MALSGARADCVPRRILVRRGGVLRCCRAFSRALQRDLPAEPAPCPTSCAGRWPVSPDPDSDPPGRYARYNPFPSACITDLPSLPRQPRSRRTVVLISRCHRSICAHDDSNHVPILTILFCGLWRKLFVRTPVERLRDLSLWIHEPRRCLRTIRKRDQADTPSARYPFATVCERQSRLTQVTAADSGREIVVMAQPISEIG